jgi:hypothetical protein
VFDAPKEMAVGLDGNIYVMDTENHAIRKIDATTWIVTTIASGLARPHGCTGSAGRQRYGGRQRALSSPTAG